MKGEDDASALLSRIEELVARIESWADPRAKSEAQELLRVTLELHRGALAELASRASKDSMLALAREKPGVAAVLLLHELHPLDRRTRAENALESLRGALEKAGAEVRSIVENDGDLRVIVGSLPDRSPRAESLTSLIEEALLAAVPDARSLHVDTSALGLVPESRLRASAHERREALR